jgi:hypothetical protein
VKRSVPRGLSPSPDRIQVGQLHLKARPSPLAGEVGWGGVPSLDSGRADALREPPTLTLPHKGGGDIFHESGTCDPTAIAFRNGSS